MKYIAVLLIIVLLLQILPGCTTSGPASNPTTGSDPLSTTGTSPTAAKELKSYSFTASIIDGCGQSNHDSGQPREAHVMTSTQDIATFENDYGELYLVAYDRWNETIKKYDDSFFEEKSLILYPLAAGSSSMEYRVIGLCETQDGNVLLEIQNQTDVGGWEHGSIMINTDIVRRMILVEVDGKITGNCTVLPMPQLISRDAVYAFSSSTNIDAPAVMILDSLAALDEVQENHALGIPDSLFSQFSDLTEAYFQDHTLFLIAAPEQDQYVAPKDSFVFYKTSYEIAVSVAFPRSDNPQSNEGCWFVLISANHAFSKDTPCDVNIQKLS